MKNSSKKFGIVKSVVTLASTYLCVLIAIRAILNLIENFKEIKEEDHISSTEILGALKSAETVEDQVIGQVRNLKRCRGNKCRKHHKHYTK